MRRLKKQNTKLVPWVTRTLPNPNLAEKQSSNLRKKDQALLSPLGNSFVQKECSFSKLVMRKARQCGHRYGIV